MARREARTIRRRLRPGAVVLVAGAASEHTFKQTDLSRFGLLHIAAHGVIDEANPDRAGLLLAADSTEDGILQVRELSDLRLDGQVVVLSSCRSAGGALLGGEGPMGLARAFLASGAGSVVASLWPVRDADAFTFFSKFYSALAEGESVSAALARAQRERRASGAPAEAWAGFVVYGDGDAVPVARGRSASPWPAFGAAGLLAAAAAAGLSRRRFHAA
jgi:CHAT domain-containing protein